MPLNIMLIKSIKKILLKAKIEFGYTRKRYSKIIIQNEKISKMYIKKFLPDYPIIVDAGAHIGADSVELLRLLKNPKIYAIEPVPSIYKTLQHNTRKYKNIKLYNLALSNWNGEQELHISRGTSDAASSLLKPQTLLRDHPDIIFDEKVNVKTFTLDEWAKQNHIEKVDFLWFDLQGFELEVLKASKIIFPTVKVVHMEVSTRSTYEGVPLYAEVRQWMEQNGFYVDKEAIPKGWDMGNVLFIRKSDFQNAN